MAEPVASISTGQGVRWTFGRRRAGKAPRAFCVATHQPSQRSTPSIPSLMPLMAQLSEDVSRRPKRLYKKRTPVTFRPKSELSIQLAGTLGKGLRRNTHCCPYPFESCSLCLWLDGSTPPGMFPCSSRHISARSGLLGRRLRPIASCSLPITHPKLGGPGYKARAGYKANFASSSSSTVLLCVPLSSSTSSHILSSKALISVSEFFFFFKPVLANPLWLALGRAE